MGLLDHLQWGSCYYQWDLFCFFLPAARALVAGQNPYLAAELTNPPWFLMMLLPFLPFSDRVISIAWFLLNLFLTIYAFHLLLSSSGLIESHYKKALGIALLSLLPWSLYNLQSGQVSAFVLLGVVATYTKPNRFLALPCLAVKPHLAIISSIDYFQKNVRERRLLDLGLAGIVTILFLLSPVVFYRGVLRQWVLLIIEGKPYSHGAFNITGMPMLFDWIGFHPSWAVLPMIIIAVLGIQRPILPVVATSTLLVSPYVRPYDLLLLGIAIPYMVQTRTGLVIALGGIAFPFLRSWLLPRTPATIDIIVPSAYFVYCWFNAYRSRNRNPA